MSELGDFDISKLEEKDLDKTIREVEEYYTMMIRRINHEFGNAITLISSSLQIIESSHPEVSEFKYWNSAMEDVQHLVKLINEISTYNNSSSINRESFSITDMLNNIVKSFSANPMCKNIDFSINVPQNMPMIYGDRLKLRQTFINIIKNAAEAINEKEFPNANEHIDVDIHIDDSDSQFIIAICDSGCGISDEQLTKIFSPMVSFKKNGTGLGLPIIKKIIEAHDGTISVKSSSQKGTTFYITLPIHTTQTETSDLKV